MKSVNQLAQEDGDTSLNEAERAKTREAMVNRCYRAYCYDHEAPPTAKQLSLTASEAAGEHLGEEFVSRICERNGNKLG